MAQTVLDRMPGDANIYIGGLFTLKRREALKSDNITHVLSVLTLPLDQSLFEGFKHHVIDIDDVEDADIIQHFLTSNAFIKEGLEGGGGVLVHCAMGKSRSATILLAHHLATRPTSDPVSALMLLRQARPMAEPNPGFMDQLHLYHRMHCPEDVASHPLYQRWCYKREARRSRANKQAPGSEFIVFEDEMGEKEGEGEEEGRGKGEVPAWDTVGERSGDADAEKKEEYRCRRCRTQLGDSTYLVPHTPRSPTTTTPNFKSKNRNSSAQPPPQQCAHLFLNPLSWMRPTLSQGNLDGRLECPNAKCRQNVGKYAWQGMKCSCGEWVVPGISVARGKVDVVAVRKKDGGDGNGKDDDS